MALGERVQGVFFAENYLELHLDENVLRAHTRPTISVTRGEDQSAKLDSTEALLALIGNQVVSVQIRGEEEISLGFASEKVLVIPLKGEGLTGRLAVEHFNTVTPQRGEWKLISG